MTYENPYYGKSYYEDLELIPGNRYIFITKQRTKFITSEKQLEGTFIGTEIDWKNTDEELPLLNPATCYKFRTEDGNIHVVSSKDITWMMPNPANTLFIPPYVSDSYIPAELEQPIADIDTVYRELNAFVKSIEMQIPRDLINWDRRCTEEEENINNQGEIIYEP